MSKNVVKLLLLCLALLVVCVIMLDIIAANQSLLPPRNQLWIIGTVIPPGALDEIVTITANSKRNISTQREYAGQVMIQIRAPWLQIPPTPQKGINPVPVENLPFQYQDFWVDDFQLADEISLDLHGFTAFGIPYYHPVYGYQMLYTVGDNLRRVTFRMENETGSSDTLFEILISIENRFCCFGR